MNEVKPPDEWGYKDIENNLSALAGFYVNFIDYLGSLRPGHILRVNERIYNHDLNNRGVPWVQQTSIKIGQQLAIERIDPRIIPYTSIPVQTRIKYGQYSNFYNIYIEVDPPDSIRYLFPVWCFDMPGDKYFDNTDPNKYLYYRAEEREIIDKAIANNPELKQYFDDDFL